MLKWSRYNDSFDNVAEEWPLYILYQIVFLIKPPPPCKVNHDHQVSLSAGVDTELWTNYLFLNDIPSIKIIREAIL